MELKDYCSNVSAELVGWKAKVYDIVRKLDKLSSGDKAKVADQVRDLHILIEEIENRIDRLNKECPIEWSPDRIEIEQKIHTIKSKWNEVWSNVPGGMVGG
jgi:predicted nuclease with TOPRIM domain